MNNTIGDLMDNVYSLLSGQIANGGSTIPVYKEDVPEDEDSHYILLRAEGGSSMNNKKSFSDEVIVITDVVTVFENNIDRSVVEDIDGQINFLILPTMTSGITNPTDTIIMNVARETFDYIQEQDVKKYYRKVSRYRMEVYQTS